MRMVTELAAQLAPEPAAFLAVVDREASDPAPPPGLVAMVDQHAAAVRDTLSPGVGEIHPGDLAGYARGVVTVAAGWDWPNVAPETTHWLRLRLASVGWLARQFGYLPTA
ncbi:DUF6401 family natural product biosynthesis protein [Hamadaea tsunoensis]|uniref:DUF6401 family natural product biosynthesis protein n=1 Tax=Hamadaea tsunoensis TaxID=53368 RepID=UPI0012FC80A8|nr:DUF6401 family natural product biosynthesis protein [Hamadaea tsunoensis]